MTFPDVFAGQIDQDRQERAAQEAKQRAVELMRHYSNVADAAVISVGTFVPPQSVAVHVPPPDNTIGRPIEHGGGSIEGPTGEPRRPGGPSSPLDAGSPRDGSPNPTPVSNASPVTADGGQTTTPGFADPAEVPPAGPPRGGPAGGPPAGGLAPHPVPGFDPITGRRLDPVSGRPVDVNTGRPVGGPGGRGTAGGRPAAGSPGEPGRGRSADDGHRPGRGALTGSGPMEAERAAPGRGGAAAARAGLSGGPAMAPAGAGARREEDQERRSPRVPAGLPRRVLGRRPGGGAPGARCGGGRASRPAVDLTTRRRWETPSSCPRWSSTSSGSISGSGSFHRSCASASTEPPEPSAPDGRLGFRLRLLARPEWELDARLHLSARDRRTSALIAAKDSTAVVAVRHADRLTLRTAPADRMSAEALALLPPHHAGTGPSITLPADTIDTAAARAGSDPGMLVRALESRGLGRSEARKIAGVTGSIVRLGHFGAARTRRSETRRRASHVVSVYDSPSGRYLFTRKPSGRHTWITLIPGTDPAITRQLDELLAELDRS